MSLYDRTGAQWCKPAVALSRRSSDEGLLQERPLRSMIDRPGNDHLVVVELHDGLASRCGAEV
jgi:hypothetical protein